MNNSNIRLPFSSKDSAAKLALAQQKNFKIPSYSLGKNSELMETANEHLKASVASNLGQHGHSHAHSSSCSHSHLPSHFSQPAPEPVPPPLAKDMSIVQAVQYNEVDRIKELIESGQVDVNAPDQEGCYLMHWASINNYVDIMRYLIAKGAVADVKGGDLKSSPLHWACRQGCTEAFFLLIDNGAAIDSTDINGIQPVHLAAQYGQLKMLAYLLGSGIDVDCRDARNFTPLIYSCLGPPPNYVAVPNSSHVCCTQFLLTFGANVNYQEPTRHYTALHFSINTRNLTSFAVLLNNPQTNFNLKTIDNCDPLTFAHMRQNQYASTLIQNHIHWSKKTIKPRFLQRYFTNESIRKWIARIFMTFIMLLIGLSANAYEYSYLTRILGPIVLICIMMPLFTYYVFDNHTMENYAFAYTFSSTILMYVTYILYLQQNSWKLIHIIYHIVTLYGLYSFRAIKTVNPGYLKKQTMTIDGNNLSREKICIAFARDPRWTSDHFCVTCLIRRPLRSKHCPADSVCIEKFDHHCTWLDACIGGRNYCYFIYIVVCSTIAAYIWMFQSISLIYTDTRQFPLKYMLKEVYDPWFVYMLIITSFNTLWVPLMTLFHLINSIYLGVTLNERLTRFRYSYFRDEDTGKFVNPFQNQMFKKFLETFGLYRLMSFFGYNRIDWSQIYDINQISGAKCN